MMKKKAQIKMPFWVVIIYERAVLGITGQGQQGSNQQSCNPLGLGLNLSALPMNPALVAAALNQAGWGLIGNLQNQPEPNFNQGFNNGPNNNSGKASERMR
jgi:hypothetical protein